MNPCDGNNSSQGRDESLYRGDDHQRYCYLIVIPSHERTRIAVEVLPDASIRLPMLPNCSHVWCTAGVTELEKLVESFLGMYLRFVRELWATDDEEKHVLWGETYDMVSVLLFEWGEWEKSVGHGMAMKYISMKDAQEGNWVETEKELGLDMKHVVVRAMKDISGEVRLRLPPWRRMGWFCRMMKWVREVTKCETNDKELYLSFRKIKDDEHSVVWSCMLDLSKTSSGCGKDDGNELVYIKAGLPLIREARRTVTVAKVLEKLNVVPQVIAVNESDGMFMQRNAGIDLDQILSAGLFLDVELLVNTVLRIQEVSADCLKDLKAGGVEVRDSEWAASNLHHILYHEALEKAVSGFEKDEEALYEVRCGEEELIKACKKISSYGFPNTLVHGDLNEDNIATNDEDCGFQFFDWDMCIIGHPLLDIERVCLFASKDEMDRLLKNVWKCWERLVGYEEFRKLLRLMMVLVDAAALDLFLRDAEFQDEDAYNCNRRLRDIVEFMQSTLENIKPITSTFE